MVIGLTGLLISLSGLVVGWYAIDRFASGMGSTLTLAADSLDRTEEGLLLMKDSLQEMQSGLTTSQQLVEHSSQSLQQMQPMLTRLTTVTSQDIPATLLEVEATLPQIADQVRAIDEALTLLSNFQLNQRFLGAELKFDLGFDYESAGALDQSIEEVGPNLANLAENFQQFESELQTTQQNFGQASRDVSAIATDLQDLNQQVTQLGPLVDNYLVVVNQAQSQVEQLRLLVRRQTLPLKVVLVGVMLWLAAMQLTPLYLGWSLMTHRADD